MLEQQRRRAQSVRQIQRRTAPPARTAARPTGKLPQSKGKAQEQSAGKYRRFVNFSIPRRFDFSFFMIVLILLAFGLIMLFSATYASAKYTYGDSYYFVKRQLIFSGLGFAAMIVLSFIDYHIFAQRFIVKIAIIVGAGLMILVRLMGITSNGAERWIQIGEITIQPSEILKFVTIMVIAEYMQRSYDKLRDFKKGFIPLVVRVGVACGLVVMQPHLSATVIIFAVSLAMLCIGGAKASHIWLMLIGVAAAGALVVFVIFPAMDYNYVEARMLSWQNPEADIRGDTYQTYQSLISVGSGGLFGLGLGNSREKYGYLPFTENDFIFSIICEELGFVGAMLVILLFFIFLLRGFYIASSAPDKFGMLLCSGIVIQLTLQAFLNIAVVSNAIPNTGVSLPFISYGGTALIMQMAEIGIVLNISRKASLI